MQKWLSVVGIGEDGILGLNPVARSFVEQAEVLVGGDRKELIWASPLNDNIEEIIRRRGQAR